LNQCCKFLIFAIDFDVMNVKSMYDDAQVFVAGIRVYDYINKTPPSLSGLSDLLKISEDELARVSRILEEHDVIGIIKSGGETRFYILDHLKIEDFPRSQDSLQMKDEISRFKDRQYSRLQEIEKSLNKGAKSSVFSELENALKDPSNIKRKKNPLD